MGSLPIKRMENTISRGVEADMCIHTQFYSKVKETRTIQLFLRVGREQVRETELGGVELRFYGTPSYNIARDHATANLP